MIKDFKQEEIKSSLQKLAKRSKEAKRLLSKEKLNVADVLTNGFTSYAKEFTFHPSGACDCIKRDDSYFLGIKCNHLMWAEGWCEYEDEWIEIDSPNDPVILIFGNHKGSFKAQVIY